MSDRGPTFEWLGTAGFRIRHSGGVILVDPYLSRRDLATPLQVRLPQDMADTGHIFVSHGHFDHLADVPAIVECSDADIFCSEVAARTLEKKGVPAGRINTVRGHQLLELGDFSVRTDTCRHIVFDARLVAATAPRVLKEIGGILQETEMTPSGPVMIFTFDFGGRTVMHTGSLGLKPRRARSGLGRPPDVFMPPLQGHSDICRLAAELTAAIGPRAVVPHHYDDFFPPVSQSIDLEPFRRMLSELAPGCVYFEPEINKEFCFDDIFDNGRLSGGRQCG